MKTCKICNKELVGKQRKFCSVKCKNGLSENKANSYKSQQERAAVRRGKLILMKGNCCSVCGYNKNRAALCFHHLDPQLKSFNLDARKCSNCNWDSLVAEAEKCQLLCLNCHAEIHYPELST